MPSYDERFFSMLIYLLSLIFPILGPLVIWLLKRNESGFIDYHGKEYFNFLISYFVYSIICGLLAAIFVGSVLLSILGIMVVVFTIIAAIRSFQGERYRFPFIMRFII
ncbi:DUF4870 domain-containing protein [Pueribacillus theae]|uniref:DUF4870 domain-containing protein n=1 Tax=Pueribacillus theae TaxID=2171751 RepID=A0A2U1JU96_9BACI|nr:DUF4870 domain-containing protein [Pueribacillus theae]PWA08418.1 DUF4870 domain-containing protein [Pueribacillus theae]